MIIKALTLTQPWASLMALEEKLIETRGRKDGGRPTWMGHRGLVAIHSSVEWNQELAALCLTEPFKSALRRHGLSTSLPHGAILCFSFVTGCVRTEAVEHLTAKERAFGDYSPGRWCWPTRIVHRLTEPVPARGAQGLWNWTVPAYLEPFLSWKSVPSVDDQLALQLEATHV